MLIALSPEFKKMTTRAVLAIGLFVVLYLLLVGFAVGLTVFSLYAGIGIIAFHPNKFTLLIGGGIILMSSLILIFFLKFIFSRKEEGGLRGIQITAEDEPALFALIEEVVSEVGTKLPKKVFLVPDVNASVFYDSNFWSLFLPIRKNLNIGLGLINTVSVAEFKSLLAHEFGHFSQRSMTVGSYMYYVNRLIYNLLYENTSYENLAAKIQEYVGIFSWFVYGALKVVVWVQVLLQKIHKLIHLHYYALSREMEFHADAVAAHVAGADSAVSLLLRTHLADYAYNQVLGYYNERIPNHVKTENIYPQQYFVMNYVAAESDIPVKDGLPRATQEDSSRYNKSKLMLNNQWASHPSIEDRIRAIRALAVAEPMPKPARATTLFQQLKLWEKEITARLFDQVDYKDSHPTWTAFETFCDDFVSAYTENDFPKVFNGYYNAYSAPPIDLAEAALLPVPASEAVLFSAEMVAKVYTLNATREDQTTMRHIQVENTDIPSFEYDGERYTPDDSEILIQRMEGEIKTLVSELHENDKAIYRYCLSLEEAYPSTSNDSLNARYTAYLEADAAYDKLSEVINVMHKLTRFMYETTPADEIKKQLARVAKHETLFKESCRELLATPVFAAALEVEERADITKYCEKNLVYYSGDTYITSNTDILFLAMRLYGKALMKGFYQEKTRLLTYQAALIERAKG